MGGYRVNAALLAHGSTLSKSYLQLFAFIDSQVVVAA
jgi:hypothetical protein